MTRRARLAIGTVEGDPADENTVDAPRATRHARNRDVVWVEAVRGRCALADVSDFRQFELTGPSAEVWSRIDGHRSDDAVVRAVLAAYPEHPDTAYAECVSLIDAMTELGLLVPRPDTDRGGRDRARPDRRGRAVKPAQKGTVE
jgi:hypothetical protein